MKGSLGLIYWGFFLCDLECSKMEWIAFGKYELSFSRFNGFLEEIYLQ